MRFAPAYLAITTAMLVGCSPKKLAVNAFAGALSGSGGTYATDDDLQLVRDALPFALKTYESVLSETPRHRELLGATAKGFTVYAYGYLAHDAEIAEDASLQRALAIRRRARRLLLRARDYGLRGLDVSIPGLSGRLLSGDVGELEALGQRDLATLSWAGAAWAGAIAIIKDDADLIGDLPVVEAMLRRSLAIDEKYEFALAHELMIVLESGLAGGSIDRAREHFARAVALNRGASASTYVSLAENVAVQNQDVREFSHLLEQALAVDLAVEPGLRVSNLLAQERALWLSERTPLLFIDVPEEEGEP